MSGDDIARLSIGEQLVGHAFGWDMAINGGLDAASPLGRLPTGVIKVEGAVTAHFSSPGLSEWVRQLHNTHENHCLRIMRPYMPKRRFQRLRGKCKARRMGR